MNYERCHQTIEDIEDVYMYIYGDSIMLYRSQVVIAGCESVDFRVAISGVDTLRIILQETNMLRLVDCVLHEDAASLQGIDICLSVYGDGELLYKSETVTAGCEPQNFEVSLTGIRTMRVAIQGETMLRLVDCVLERAKEGTVATPVDSSNETASSPNAPVYGATAADEYVYLYQLPYSAASESGFALSSSVKDNFGTVYSNGLSGTMSRPDESLPAVQGQTWQEYEMDGTYSQLRGQIVLNMMQERRRIRKSMYGYTVTVRHDGFVFPAGVFRRIEERLHIRWSHCPQVPEATAQTIISGHDEGYGTVTNHVAGTAADIRSAAQAHINDADNG